MRNLLALIGALVIGFAVAGWYCGWYQIGVTKSSDGNLRVETNVNTKKVADDTGALVKKVETAVGSQIDKTAADAKEAVPPTPVATPGPQDAGQKGDTKVKVFGVDLTPAEKK